MSQHYSDTTREDDPHTLPDLEVFQLTALEVAASMEDEVYEFSKRHEFQLCHINDRVRDAMLDAMVEELGIAGGWFYWFCFPGCLPDRAPIGPFSTRKESVDASRNE